MLYYAIHCVGNICLLLLRVRLYYYEDIPRLNKRWVSTNIFFLQYFRKHSLQRLPPEGMKYTVFSCFCCFYPFSHVVSLDCSCNMPWWFVGMACLLHMKERSWSPFSRVCFTTAQQLSSPESWKRKLSLWYIAGNCLDSFDWAGLHTPHIWIHLLQLCGFKFHVYALLWQAQSLDGFTTIVNNYSSDSLKKKKTIQIFKLHKQ